MGGRRILDGKKLLIIDNEPDVLETLEDLLPMCKIDIAADFATGEELLAQNQYDMAILDIMGVDGYELLDLANKMNVPALMLTANALSPDNFEKSVSKGAKAYIPKEEISEIAVFLIDLLEVQAGNGDPRKWFERLKGFYDKQFGNSWYGELI